MKNTPGTQNLAAELMAEVERIVREIVKRNSHLVGVLLSGSLARGYADQYSDVDLEVFYHRGHPAIAWPDGWELETFTPQGNYIDAEKRCFEVWMNPRNDGNIWTMATRWDKSHAEVLYDPQGKLRDLLRKKLVFRPGELRRLRNEARDCLWLACGVADAWIERHDIAAAHHSVNCGISLLLDYLFLKSRQFIPFEKWKLFLAKQLDILPKGFEQRVHEALLVTGLSEPDLRRRQSALLPLVKEAHQLPNKRA
jgi:hypothetical protein